MAEAVKSGDADIIQDAVKEVSTLEIARIELAAEAEDVQKAQVEDAAKEAEEEAAVEAPQAEAETESEAEAVSEEATDAAVESEAATESVAEPVAEVMDAATELVDCDPIAEAYLVEINSLQETLDKAEALTTSMADSLANIDPNMENGEEGKALVRKMYKIRNE